MRGNMKDLVIYVGLGFILTTLLTVAVFAKQDTCPDGGDWTKIDSSDLSQYPVAGAVNYCFKAGNWLDSVYPNGGFGQSGSCNNGIQYCDLSHWSYLLGTPTPTPTQPPTITPISTPTLRVNPTPTPTHSKPTPTPTSGLSPTPIKPTTTPTPTHSQPTPTNTPKPNPTATPKPEEPKDEWYKVEQNPELYPAGMK